MSLEDKLSQLRTLLAQRDEIDRQLEAIIGHYGPKQVETRQSKWYKADKRGKELQREIDQDNTSDRKNKQIAPKKTRYDGDDARRNDGIMQALAKGEKPRHVAKGVSVQTVYNIKARSKTTHAKAQRATREAQAEPEERPASKPLDGYQYDALRDAMLDRDFSSAEYALVNKLSPREVNAAIKSRDYDDYLDSR